MLASYMIQTAKIISHQTNFKIQMNTAENLIKKEQEMLKGHDSTASFTSEQKAERIVDEEHQHPLQEMQNKKQSINKDIAFWNGLVEGKLEVALAISNLFLLLMILTLTSQKYNGPNPDGILALGWVSCGLTVLCYTIGPLIKFCYIPSLQKDADNLNSEAFKTYQQIIQGDKTLKGLSFSELFQLKQTLQHQSHIFRQCFPNTNVRQLLHDIHQLYANSEEIIIPFRNTLEKLKLKQKNAKWWQNLWQGYILGKTFSIPSVMQLIFIITALSNASKTVSISANILQGYLAIGIWVFCILVYAFIKCILWDNLNEKAKQSRLTPFYIYFDLLENKKKLKELALTDLEEIKDMMENRSAQFEQCFPTVELRAQLSHIREEISKQLPNRQSEDEELKLKQIILNHYNAKNTHATWNYIFSFKTIMSIITSKKFFIVMAITLVEQLPSTKQGVRQSQIACGTVSVSTLVLGYIFYIICACYFIEYLQNRAFEARSSPFQLYRLVYFGNKTLQQYEVFELDDICDAIQKRKEQFAQCFPKIVPDSVQQEIRQILKTKNQEKPVKQKIAGLLKDEEKARKSLQYWSSFSDGPIFLIVYSFLVEIIICVSTFSSGIPEAAAVLGWVGVGLVAFLIMTVITLKYVVVPNLAAYLKACSVRGISQFNQVFLKKKTLKEVLLSDLQLIKKEIEENTTEFKRCFPTINIASTLNQVRALISIKSQEKIPTFSQTGDQVQSQLLSHQLANKKALLAFLTKIIREFFYPILPICLVVEMLWIQSIAISSYGIKVNGFIGVSVMAIVTLYILIFKLWLEGYLQNQIKEIELRKRILDKKKR